MDEIYSYMQGEVRIFAERHKRIMCDNIFSNLKKTINERSKS